MMPDSESLTRSWTGCLAPIVQGCARTFARPEPMTQTASILVHHRACRATAATSRRSKAQQSAACAQLYGSGPSVHGVG
eukprot:663379-Rhodomonas_salina.2